MFQWTIKYSTKSVDFLDLTISLNDVLLSTEAYSKPRCAPQYIPYRSQHSPACKNTIYRGEAVRHLLNCSSSTDYDEKMAALRIALSKRGYPSNAHIPYDAE